MKRNYLLSFWLLLPFLSFLGCAKMLYTPPEGPFVEDPPLVEIEERPMEAFPDGDLKEGQFEGFREELPMVSEEALDASGGVSALKDIFFQFDQAHIPDEAQLVLEENARWLKTHPKTRIMIEGHCDERGTTDYNIALGFRRATGVKRFLVAIGVASSRINIVSYGEENPSCSAHHESCWFKNRRVHFTIE